MAEFFEAMDPLLRAFWYIALPTSMFFILISVLTLFGIGVDDAEFDFDTSTGSTDSPLKLLSLRNLINFLLGFSWTGVSFYNTIPNRFVLIVFSIFVGLLFVYVFFRLMKFIVQLSADHSFSKSDVVGKTGEVYLNIPEKETGTGKVLISFRGSVRELEAITKGDAIPTGSTVQVDEINKDNLLIVTKSK